MNGFCLGFKPETEAIVVRRRLSSSRESPWTDKHRDRVSTPCSDAPSAVLTRACRSMRPKEPYRHPVSNAKFPVWRL